MPFAKNRQGAVQGALTRWLALSDALLHRSGQVVPDTVFGRGQVPVRPPEQYGLGRTLRHTVLPVYGRGAVSVDLFRAMKGLDGWRPSHVRLPLAGPPGTS